jgi:lactoylglutathione lyase
MSSFDGSHVGAVGITVGDLKKARDFYTRVLGMEVLLKLSLPDMDEIIVGYRDRRSAAVALMHHTDGVERRVSDKAVKLVIYTPDPPAMADAIRAEGLEVTREPEPVPELGDAVVGFAKDPDGYTLELLQA